MNKQTKICSIVATLLILACSSTLAIVVGWSPDMTLVGNWGFGVNLTQQKDITPRITIMSQTPQINPSTGGSSEQTMFTQQTSDLVSSFSLNANVSLSDLISSGSFGFSFLNNQTYNANAVNFVYTAVIDFGETLYQPTALSPDFLQWVANQGYSGEALYNAIIARYGAYYLQGYTSQGLVSVVYSFHYTSQSTVQQLQTSISASAGTYDISTQASSFFANNDTAASLTYQFYTSDTRLPPSYYGISPSGTISSLADFNAFVTNVHAYAASLTAAQAQVTGYVLTPILNLPGFLNLVSTTNIAAPPSADYNGFLTAYSALQTWNNQFTSWSANPSSMSWISPGEQAAVFSNRVVSAAYIDELSLIASNHFTTGSPLVAPPDVFDYIQSLSSIPLPTIYTGARWQSQPGLNGNSMYLGYVDFGPKNLTVTNPFNSIVAVNGGVDSDLLPLYYDPPAFLAADINPYPAPMGLFQLTSTWNYITNEMTSRNIGLFLDVYAPSQEAGRHYVLRDLTASANTLAALGSATLNSGGASSAVSVTRTTNVTVSLASSGFTNQVGLRQSIPFNVKNAGCGIAYGVDLTFTLDPSFDFAGAGGNHGFGSYDINSRKVAYTVGPLGPGDVASLSIDVIPMVPGRLNPIAGPIGISADGTAISNPGVNPTMFVVEAAPIALNVTGASNGRLQLQWASDTDRLAVDQSLSLSTPLWTVVSNSPIIGPSQRFLSFPESNSCGFFRLRSR